MNQWSLVGGFWSGAVVAFGAGDWSELVWRLQAVERQTWRREMIKSARGAGLAFLAGPDEEKEDWAGGGSGG